MTLRTFATTIITLSAMPALALASSGADESRELGKVAKRLESRYHGEVVAITRDASADERPHYHVDMSFGAAGMARLDVDARTLELDTRDLPLASSGAASLAEAAAIVAASVPGEIIAVQVDAVPGVAPHYEIDVRLTDRAVAQLRVDATTRGISWRTPYVVAP
jgi:uncharacterized membrane protein YkoI